jgi:hypothetical protein
VDLSTPGPGDRTGRMDKGREWAGDEGNGSTSISGVSHWRRGAGILSAMALSIALRSGKVMSRLHALLLGA